MHLALLLGFPRGVGIRVKVQLAVGQLWTLLLLLLLLLLERP